MLAIGKALTHECTYLEILVAKVIQPYSRVVAGDEEFGVAPMIVMRVDSSDLTALRVLTSSRANVDLTLILQTLGLVKHAQASQTAGHRAFAVRRECHGCDHVRYTSSISNALIRYAPKP